MSIKLKRNQARENLVFTVKKLSDAYKYEMGEEVSYYIQDIIVATAQNNHNDLLEALHDLRVAIENKQGCNDLNKFINKLSDILVMEYTRKEVL